MLELKHIHKYYNPGTVNEMCLFRDFNFRVEDGEFVSVVGSNGSGKTSMLNIISRTWASIGDFQKSGVCSKIRLWERARL